MKVLTLSRNYPNNVLPRLGPWVEGLVCEIANLCEQRVIAPVPYAPLLPGLPETYARFRRIPPSQQTNGIEVWHPRFITGPGYWFHSFEVDTYHWGIWQLVDRLREEYPFDLIHAHVIYPDGVSAVRLGQRYGVPVVITEHAIWQPWMDNYPRVRRHAIQAAHGCAFQIAASQRQRDSIQAVTRLPEKVRLIPIGMEQALFKPANQGNGQKPKQILFVGRIQYVKGVDVLMKAMKQVVRQHPDARLVMVGGSFYQQWGKEEGELQALVRELGLEPYVEFVGVKPAQEVARLMQESSLLVLPSRRESFGSVLVEALGCGIPVVATRCGGPEDIVNEAVGLLVPPEDADALAVAINHIFMHPDQYNPQHLSAYAHQRFSWSRVAEQTFHLYEEALGDFVSNKQ